MSYEHILGEIIEILQRGDQLPERYKDFLFPVNHKEYELEYSGKMRKEDVLSNEDGILPIPLQIEKIYNNTEIENEEWSNMLVYGDNLHFLKTIYQNNDPLIKDKIKGKVKLIYIDPPFATSSEFKDRKGQKAYSDKVQGAEFIEFLRRRLIVAKEILAPDGVIYVHLDWKKAHYIKLVMDEIFGENYFQNEIVWCYNEAINSKKRWNRKHDVIYFYSNSDKFTFNYNEVLSEYSEKTKEKYSEDENGNLYRLMGRGIEGSPIKSKRDVSPTWEKTNPELTYRHYIKDGVLPVDYWNIPIINQNSKERLGYPTQKPEELLAKIIKAATNEGDLILDFFAGSGTSIAVAEKLNRRWVACDIGKLSIYTIQKRLLEISNSKSLDNKKKKYDRNSKRFYVLNTGYYNLDKILLANREQYFNFVMNLFQVTPLKNKRINGITIDGEKADGYNCLVFPYWEYDVNDIAIDEEYIENLHQNIGDRVGNRLYIITPVSYTTFISDYYELDNVRYYFLKVPYEVIKELHKVDFKPIQQPRSKNNINALEQAVGFHFMHQPIVESELIIEENNVILKLNKFYSKHETTKKDNLENFQSLSMVLIDKNFDGVAFKMSDCFFSDEIIEPVKKRKDKKNADDSFVNEEEVIKKLKNEKQLTITQYDLSELGKTIMIIYIDIYGNEFKETKAVK